MDVGQRCTTHEALKDPPRGAREVVFALSAPRVRGEREETPRGCCEVARRTKGIRDAREDETLMMERGSVTNARWPNEIINYQSSRERADYS